MIKKVTASEKKKLKEKLKKLDKKLSRLYLYKSKDIFSQMLSQFHEDLFILDEKRKQIRNKLKGYE